MIALALRKRFAQMNQITDSPERERQDSERDQEPEDSFSESSEQNHLFGSGASNNNTPKHAVSSSKSSPRRLLVFSRPAAVAPADNKENNSGLPVQDSTGLWNEFF